MATLDDSPSLFAGQSWSDWATVAPLSPLDVPSDEGNKDKDVDDTESMKLSSEDMCLFGHCPSQDEFYLVLCEKCRKVVKPQAFKRHLQERHGLTTVVPVSTTHSSYPTSKLSSPTSKLSSPTSKLSSPTSKLSSPISKLSSPTKPVFKYGHSVPTKASVKEVPPAISNAQKMGAAISARLSKNTEKNKKNHSMPVVKVERMEVKKVSQHYEPVNVTKPNTLPNGNVKETNVITTSVASSPLPITSTISSQLTPSTTAVLTPVSQSLTPFSVNNVTVVMATTTLTTTTTTCMKTTMSVVASPSVAMTSWITSSITSGSSNSAVGVTGTCVSNISSGMNSLNASNSSVSISSVSSTGSTGSVKKEHKKKSGSVDKPDKLIPCKDREYDCNKHCGVIAEDTGKPCTRSLTCKTHALSLRRKVTGRRKPFDDLLKEHRAAKELMLKQRAEQKAAQSGTIPSPHITGSQLAKHLMKDIPVQTKPVHPKLSLDPPRLPYQDLIPPKKSPKPNDIMKKRVSTPSLYSPPDPGGGISSMDLSSRLSDGEGEEEEAEKGDNSFVPYHPRPAAVCTFGARSHMMGSRKCFMFGRKTDFLRAAFLNVLDKHLNPPPPKKLCVESNLPKEPQFMSSSKDPYEFNMIDGTRSNQFKPVLNSNNNNKPLFKAKSKPPNVNRSKIKDVTSGSKSPGHSNSAMPQGSNCTTSNLKRKRSGSDTAASSPTTYTSAQAFNTVISSITSLNSHTNSALTAIAIPNLSTANISHLNANLPTAKAPKNSIYKDVGLLVTGLDPSLMNGQYINIASAHPQQVDDKAMQQTHVITGNKNNNPKILNLEPLTLQKNNLIVPQLFMESAGTTVLAPVTIPSSLNNPVVTIATNPTVSPPQQSPSSATTYRSGSASPQVSTHVSLPNGIIPTSSDKSSGNHRHNLLHHNKKGLIHMQGAHGIVGNTVIAAPNNPSHVLTTQLAQLQVKPVAKQGATNKVSMPVSLTFPLQLGVPGQQPTLYIRSNEDAQQQVSNSPSNHMS